MAILWRSTFTIDDRKGEDRLFEWFFQSLDITTITDPSDDPIAYVSDLTVALKPVITGRIKGVALSTNVTIPVGAQGLPDLDSDVEEGARFFFNTTQGVTKVRIPTFDEALLIPNTRLVDTSNADVLSLLDLMITPIDAPGGYGVTTRDYRGAEILSLKKALEQFKAS